MKPVARWGNCEIHLEQGDITLLDVDAIVNAANSELRGGGGVDGAIHRRGGPAIMEQCRKIITRIGALSPGEAVITAGGNLTARHVIHALGPIYHHDTRNAPSILAEAYRNSMAVARQNQLRSLAFPCISTGAYGYPPDEACRVAIQTVREELAKHGKLEKLVFCTFLQDDYHLYAAALEASKPG